MAYWDKLDGGDDALDPGSTDTQQTGNYWPAGEDYWPAAETGGRRLGDAGSGEPGEIPYDYEDGQP